MTFGPAMYGLEPPPDPLPTCSACGGAEHLRAGSMWHPAPICKPCFIVWYDPDEAIDVTDPTAVGLLSLKLKAAGKYPWTGEYAPSLMVTPQQRSNET